MAVDGDGNRYPHGTFVEHQMREGSAGRACERCGCSLEGVAIMPFAQGGKVYRCGNVWTTGPLGSAVVPCFPAVPAYRRSTAGEAP